MGPLRVAYVVLGCFILASVGWSEDAAPPAPKDVTLPDPDKSFHDERLAEMREVAEAFPRDGDPPASPVPAQTPVEAHSAPAPPDVVAASHGDPVAAPNTPPHSAAQPDAPAPTDASATEHHEPQKAAAAAAPVPAPDAAVAATPPVAEQHAETTPQELAALPTPAGAPPPVADAAAKPIDQQQHSEAAPRAAEAAPPPPEPAPVAAAALAAAAAPAAAVIEPLAVAAASVSPSSPPPSNSGTPSSPPKTIRPNARRAPRVVSRYGDALSGYEYAGSGAHAADREKLAKLGEEGGGGDTQQQQRKAEDPDRGSFMDDDYYGMNMSPQDHIDPAAFQPSHTLSFEMGPGATINFFEDASMGDVGKVIRGDWFVTSGDELNAIVTVFDSVGREVYKEGPYHPEDEYEGGMFDSRIPQSEGSFNFRIEDAGVFRVSFLNPSSSTSRTVTFAWLKGRDDDDPYTSEDWYDGRGAYGEEAGSTKNATHTVKLMMGRSSAVHKRIDEVIALLEHADVRHKRHLHTAQSTNKRVWRFTLLETGIIVLVALLQVLAIRRFDIRTKTHTWV